ncbi:MAG: PHP domain-containing protein [Acidobacteria bacterium]|nr:PHP domain-containing protein [Acidobacteriota bacterium]
MIDLHAHTFHSDGSLSPEELLALGNAAGLEALAITDHDTFRGYDEAASLPRSRPIELICGIELSSKHQGRSVHLLGYFLRQGPADGFRRWLEELETQRKDRNRRLTHQLQQLGAPIELHEAEALGRTMTGRPHFARVLVAKGFVRTYEEAFERYLGEAGLAYVEREAPALEEGIERIRQAGGVSSLAHPVRIRVAAVEDLVRRLAGIGLDALEVFHSDHGPAERKRFLELARCCDLAVTGGSDFHGAIKPRIKLGSVPVERRWLDELKDRRP